MAIRQVITFRVQAGKGTEFAAGFAPIIEKVLQQPGCQQYELLVSQDDADRLVMLELWADQASLDDALKALYPGAGDPSIAFLTLLDGAPSQERYQV